MKHTSLIIGLILATVVGAAEPPGLGVEFKGQGTVAMVKDGKPFDADAFTIALWANPQNTKDSQVLAGRGAVNQQFTLYFYNNRVRMLVEFAAGKYVHANVPLPKPGAWTHYAGTYDGKLIKLFVNGKREATAQAEGHVPKSDAP
ncbi:MAG: LamG domain-containing protein, partial [Kiritimatiellaeota bacterium]|nr:LamG domain-containing protein [Kiritimatiellota bacterium]